MKAITLWQPWASLLALGLKHETRGWATFYRGGIAIHAAMKVPDMHDIQAFTVYRMIDALRPVTDHLAKTSMYLPLELLPRGCVVGTGDLVECYKIIGLCKPQLPSGEWLVTVEAAGRIRNIRITNDNLLFGDWSPGRFAWKIKETVHFEKPIPARGKQGLWNWKEAPG